jgi:maltose alpha-D-glucosyltransferase/alpha-amylase
VPATYDAAARLLGERTGRLHVALAQAPDEPAFAPEPITKADAERWEADLLANLRATVDGVRARAPALGPELRSQVAELPGRMPALERRAAGFRAQIGTAKSRVHGDYHLGQVLRTPDDDWVILDFEGEPARTIAERRAKTSPLKDVAGMLRSFGYARGAALRALPGGVDQAATARRLAEWETAARRAFLAGYRSAVRQAPVAVVPANATAFAAAVAAWELDKTVYEIGYELGNRPDWLELPLAALLDAAVRADGSADDVAGGANV